MCKLHKGYKMRSEEAIKRAHQKYEKKFATIKARIPSDEIDDIRAYIKKKGESANEFIIRLIKEEMKRNP